MANASNERVFITENEIASYEKSRGLAGVGSRLMELGILSPFGSQEIFIVDQMSIARISDVEAVSIIHDLINWISAGRVRASTKPWLEMRASTQDYGAKVD